MEKIRLLEANSRLRRFKVRRPLRVAHAFRANASIRPYVARRPSLSPSADLANRRERRGTVRQARAIQCGAMLPKRLPTFLALLAVSFSIAALSAAEKKPVDLDAVFALRGGGGEPLVSPAWA